jgi:hypothetical protein
MFESSHSDQANYLKCFFYLSRPDRLRTETMKSPRLPGPYPDRHLECQEALESRIIAIIDDGTAAGWSVADITTALIALADNLMLADAANGETDRQIAAAIARSKDG